MARGIGNLNLTRFIVVLASFAWTDAALAQEVASQAEVEGPVDANSVADTAAPEKSFKDKLFDDQDGKFDLSEMLAGGGFVPVPVIITEPAVDGGFGLVAQFIDVDQNDPTRVGRRMIGAVKTGNGSYGYGYVQSGTLAEGRVSYKFSLGRGKIRLQTYPRFLPSGFTYTNKYDFGIFGSALWHFPDKRFSIGPIIDFRQLHSKIEFEGELDEILPEFDRKLNTGAVGLGVHFDNRDNSVTPTEGINAFAEGKFNSAIFGSDRDFQIYDVDAYIFHKLSPKWRLGYKQEVDAARGRFPMFFAPSVDLRGVPSGRYQGSSTLSSELEVTHQLNDRWALVAFGGVGKAVSGHSRLFEDSSAVFAGGAGFRYRIARLLGLDAGLDLAVGPEGTVFYIQFGHAWSMGMD